MLNAKSLEITLSEDVFVIAGSSLELHIHDVAINPTSLWYTDKSLSMTTMAADRTTIIEQRSDYLTLSALQPGPLVPTVEFSSQEIGKPNQYLTVNFIISSAIAQGS